MRVKAYFDALRTVRSKNPSKQMWGRTAPAGWNLSTWSRFVASLPPVEQQLQHGAARAVDPKAFEQLCTETRAQLERQLDMWGPRAAEFRTRDYRGTAYAMKIGARKHVACIGDIHSSIHALMHTLNMMRQRGVLRENMTLAPGVTLVFLGDVVNRGPYSLPCLAIARGQP